MFRSDGLKKAKQKPEKPEGSDKTDELMKTKPSKNILIV